MKEQAHPADVFLLWYPEPGVMNGFGVQLKELPPHELNHAASLQGLLDQLATDPPMPDLTVAIRLNRRLTGVGWTQPPALRNRFASVWLYGPTSTDDDSWALFGDLIGPGGVWMDLSLRDLLA